MLKTNAKATASGVCYLWNRLRLKYSTCLILLHGIFMLLVNKIHVFCYFVKYVHLCVTCWLRSQCESSWTRLISSFAVGTYLSCCHFNKSYMCSRLNGKVMTEIALAASFTALKRDYRRCRCSYKSAVLPFHCNTKQSWLWSF